MYETPGRESGFPRAGGYSSTWGAMRTLLLGSLVFTSAAVWAADVAQPAQPAAAPAPAPAAPAAPAQPVPPPAPAKLTPEQEKQAFMAYGFLMAPQMGLAPMIKELRMSPAEIDALVQGMAVALKREQLPFPVEAIIPGGQAMFAERAQLAAVEQAAEAKIWAEKNAAFLAKVDADTTITKTASGLRYQIIAAGSAEKPTPANTVKARYTGKLCDGNVFDTTDKNGGEPVEFPLGGVVKGWTEGLQLIGKGGKIHLWIPAELGYGNQADGGPIPGGSVLEFEVELVDFK